MTEEKIDFSPLVRAVQRLEEGWTRHRRNPDDEQLGDGLIQRFKFTYEPAHKTLRRHLAWTAAIPAFLNEARYLRDRLFTCSDLPFRVDAPDWAAVSPSFREIIASTGRELSAATPDNAGA